MLVNLQLSNSFFHFPSLIETSYESDVVHNRDITLGYHQKSRIPPSPINEERFKVINSRILDVISQNRRDPSNILGAVSGGKM